MTAVPVDLQAPRASFDRTLSPGRIGSLELPNRIVLAPMGTEMGTHEGLFTEREIAYYTARAAGGAGLVMTGISAVSQDFEHINPGLSRVDTDESIAGLTALAESIHAVGGLVSLQLTAGLGRNINVVDPNLAPISASDNPHFSQPDVTCRPLEIDEIQLIVRRHGEAAASGRRRRRRRDRHPRPHRLPGRPVHELVLEPPHRPVRRHDREPLPVRGRDSSWRSSRTLPGCPSVSASR